MIKITLADRGKRIFLAGVLGVGLLAIVQGGVVPFLEGKERLRKGISAKEAAIPEMMTLAKEYQASHHAAADLEQRLARQPQGFALFPFLEQKAKDAGITAQVKYMKPMAASPLGNELSESVVEMKLEGVSLEQLVGYLGKVEVPEQLISVKRISILKNEKTDAAMDVVVQVAALGK